MQSLPKSATVEEINLISQEQSQSFLIPGINGAGPRFKKAIILNQDQQRRVDALQNEAPVQQIVQSQFR